VAGSAPSGAGNALMLCSASVNATKPMLLVDVVIVARNCAASLDVTLERLPRRGVRSVVVVDNGSSDETGQIARDHGAVVLRSPKGGYGRAARRALRHLEALPTAPGIVVFFDPTGPEDPAELDRLLVPFRHERAELVLATSPDHFKRRDLEDRAMLGLIGVIYGHSFAELSPCRAVRYAALVALGLNAEGEGWNVEMLVKAVRLGLHIVEVPLERVEKPPALGHNKRGRFATSRKLLRILRHATAR
jgi:glycosyltransferase involved in cell wall biosynthesis